MADRYQQFARSPVGRVAIDADIARAPSDGMSYAALVFETNLLGA